MAKNNLGEKTEVKNFCSKCKQDTRHTVIAQKDDLFNSPEYNSITRYMIVACKGCDTISFRKEFEDEDSFYQIDENEWELDTDIDNYPAVLEKGIGDLDAAYKLPDPVKKIYEDTLNAIANKRYTLAGIGLRATVEAICLKENIKGKNLEQKIKNMATGGIISKEDASRLQAIRFLGNDAAHDIKTPKKEQVYTALKIIAHLIESRYILSEEIRQELELPIDTYNGFKYLLSEKLANVSDTEGFSIRKLFGKDFRRLTEKENFEQQLNEEITNGTFTQLENITTIISASKTGIKGNIYRKKI